MNNNWCKLHDRETFYMVTKYIAVILFTRYIAIELFIWVKALQKKKHTGNNQKLMAICTRKNIQVTICREKRRTRRVGKKEVKKEFDLKNRE
jgi:hypothetical protein